MNLYKSFQLNVEFVNPPIPARDHDWCVYVDGEEEGGRYGYGTTKKEAILDWVEQYCEED